MKRRILSLLASSALLILNLAVPVTASAAGSQVFTGALSGTAEVPAVTTTATGSTFVEVNSTGTRVTYAVTYRGLSGLAVASHIHFGAPGVAGPIMLPLRVGPSPMVGTLYASSFTASPQVATFAGAIAAIRAGNAYVNIHTAANPGGEIRAQLIFRSGDRTFRGVLTGAAEVPAVTTSATGSAIVFVNRTGTKVVYVVTYRGLSGPAVASHIHFGAADVAGPIMLPLTVRPSPMVGTLYASSFVASPDVANFAAAVAAIRSGRAYVNIHTAANPGGEIRAQLR